MHSSEQVYLPQESIVAGVNLVPLSSDGEEQLYALSADAIRRHNQALLSQRYTPDHPDFHTAFFTETAVKLAPEAVVRPRGDTTLFTSAGVQRLETFLNQEGVLSKGAFVVAQPVIRTQFMDRVCNGTSTAFINLSAVSVDSTPDDYLYYCDQLIRLVGSYGINLEDLRFTIGSTPDRWGEREFHKTLITVHYQGVELGEVVYIQGYQLQDGSRISVTDLGFGIERLVWGIDPSRPYLGEFAPLYEQLSHLDSNHVTAIADCVRSMVLIAGDGVTPSAKNQGFRLRELSRRFVARTAGLKIPLDDIVRMAYQHWVEVGYNPAIPIEQVLNTVRTECERNFNAKFLENLRSAGTSVQIEINQSTASFLKQLRFSVKPEQINMILEEM